MNFSQRIKQARLNATLTQTQVSEYFSKLGTSVKPYAISSWETGKHKPDLEQFAVLCKAYKADATYLLTGSKGEDNPLLKGLNERGRTHATGYLKLLKCDPVFTEEEAKQPRIIHLYDMPVSAGTGMYLDDDNYEEMEADASTPDATDFAVRVSGDSMEPKFHDEQILYIRKQSTLSGGEVGIFLLNGEAYVKKLVGCTLVSLNPKYSPIEIHENDDFRVFGKVIGAS